MATIIWQPKTGYKLGTVVQLDTKYYVVHQVDGTGTSNGTDPRVSTWYWKVTTAPAAPVPSATVWSAGVSYGLGTVVSKNGKYFKVYQVGATGNSNGTDPEVSTWYWQVTTAPTVAPAPTPVPAPTPTPSPAPATGGPLPLPKRIVGTYFTLWGGGARITSVPLHYNLIYLFHAVPAGGGAFSFSYGSSVSAAEIDECQKRGQRVVLTVGGANAGFNFQTRAQSDAFIASFRKMNDQLGGVDGCDFNNFEAFVGSSGTEMAYIGKSLKTIYGSNFSISCPPHPGGGYAPMDRAITKAMATAGVLDYAGPQFYDSPDLTQTALIVALIKEWVVHLGGADKVVIGLSSNYAQGPTLTACMTAWNQLEALYPNLRGVFAWSAQDDARSGYKWGEAMAPIVKS